MMLVGFSFKNFASFYNEAIFTMMACKKDEFRDFNTFSTSHGDLLKSALIYGPNGSGKTNWIKALYFMKRMVIGSISGNKLINMCENFKFQEKAYSEPTSFEISFIKDDILFDYGFEVLNNQINREWLYKKKKRKIPIFTREGSDWKEIKLYSDMKKAEKIKNFTRKDALFLTAAAMFNIGMAKDIQDWFENLSIFMGDHTSPVLTANYISNSKINKEKALRYLNIADIGIEDFEILVEEVDIEDIVSIGDSIKENISRGELKINNKPKLNAKIREYDLVTKHNIYNEHGEVVGDTELSFVEYQSQGTIKFFELLGPILEALEKGKVVVIDEVDARLHCAIVAYLISLFNSIDKNPGNGQLICNTHNVLLLEENIRRDQIWFVQKDKYMGSELYCLDDFKEVRKNDPKLKKYLLGVYGAIPKMDGSDFFE